MITEYMVCSSASKTTTDLISGVTTTFFQWKKHGDKRLTKLRSEDHLILAFIKHYYMPQYMADRTCPALVKKKRRIKWMEL